MLRDWTIKLGDDEWIIKNIKNVHTTLCKLQFVEVTKDKEWIMRTRADPALIVTVEDDGRQYILARAAIDMVKRELGVAGFVRTSGP